MTKISITRRGLIAGLGISALVSAQETSAQKPTIEEDLKSAREAIDANAAKLAAVQLPMSVEPAFVFKA